LEQSWEQKGKLELVRGQVNGLASARKKKKKRVEGAKKRKAIKKKTDMMGLTKVGRTRSQAAKKVRKYKDKFDEFMGR